MGDQNNNDRHVPQRVTLKAVAKAARVSPITVSNFVNGRFESMSAKTRERVQTAVTELNYRVNVAARGLRKSHHYCVALIVVDPRPAFLTHPAHHQVAAGLSNLLNGHGYALAIEGVSPERLRDISYLDRLSADALCLIASGPMPDRQAMLERLLAIRQPVVVFHEPPTRSGARTCYVRSDDRAGGKLIATHMLEQGARRILLLLPRRVWAPMTERANGIKAALRGVKDATLSTARIEGLSVAQVGAELNEYMKSNEVPDAVLAGNDLLAAAAQKYFRKAGYDIPNDIRIGGFGGYDLIQYLDPTITSIRIPSYAMGQVAGQEILTAISAGNFSRSDILLPVELVQGEST
jgi:DNA-binding LacI/PurR family transcriptional regulator